MQATYKNINYGTIIAGGDVHIGDKIYVIERDFSHSILFLRIEQVQNTFQSMLSVKGPDEESVPLLIEKVSLPIDRNLFDQVDDFQDYRRNREALRIRGTFPTSSQALETSIQTAIYQSFLTGEIGKVCTDFLELLQNGKIRDLLLVISTEIEVVQNLPWEMVLSLLTSDGSNTLPRNNFGLVRSREKTVQAFKRQGPMTQAAPIKLLFIPALPENLSERSKTLEIEQEQKKIIDAVRRLEVNGSERPRLVMEILDCANLEEIKSAITARSHDIIHISGHGQFRETDKKGILVMENEEGDQQEVTGNELGLALRSFASIKLLVVSACETAVGGSESSTAEQLAAVGVPAVLAMRFSVTDAGARLFTEKLYERLAYGDPLTKAMHDARQELWRDVQQRRANAPEADPSAEWFTPVLYQNQIIGPLIKPDQYQADTLSRFYPKLDFLRGKHTRIIGEGFIGRKRLLILLRQHLKRGEHVCLHGLGGLGKTTTAEAFAHHYRQRYGYEVLLFSGGANLQEAVILEKIYSRWKSRTQPAEDMAAELKAQMDSPDTEPEQKLQLVLDNCLDGRRTILILDNFEDVQTQANGVQQQAIVLERLAGFIRYLLQNCPPDCHVLFTTRYAISGLDGLVTHLKLDKLSYAEQYRYLNFSPILRRIPLDQRDLLHQRFDGHPRALQFLEGLLTKAPQTDLPTLVGQAEGQVFEDLLLGRIFDRLTASEQEVFAVASVFFSRSKLTALNTVLDNESLALPSALVALRDWSLCFWDETDQVFEVHVLTREWMRKQGQPEQERFKTLSQQIGVYYRQQSTLEDLTLAKDYFAQAEDWAAYTDIVFQLEGYYRLVGMYPLAGYLSQELLNRNLSPKTNADALNALGSVYESLGQYVRAMNLYQQSLPIYQEIGDRRGEAAALNNIGLNYNKQCLYEQALWHCQQSLAISRQIGDRSGESNTLNSIGLTYHDQAQYGLAMRYFEQAIAIAREIGDHGNESTTLNNIGLFHRSQGQYEQALDYYHRSLAIVKEMGDRSSECLTLNNIGLVYRNQGLYGQALDYYQQSLAISHQIGVRSTQCLTLNNIGNVYHNQGQYEKALIYYEQALIIAQQIGDRSTECSILNNMGDICRLQGQHEHGLTYFEKALAIAREISDQNNECILLNNIGDIYANQGEYKQAVIYFEKSLAISRQIGDQSSECATLNNIGHIYLSQGQYRQALPYFEQSLAISQKIGEPVFEASVATNLGIIYLNQYQNFRKAIYWFLRSYNMLTNLGSPNASMPASYLNSIKQQIGERRYNQIIQSINQSNS